MTEHSNPTIAPAPLFRDPIYDGAADPTVIWNRYERSWWIVYTNRRATAPEVGVSWVHGTDLGVASSDDGGMTWVYRGVLQGLEFEPGRNTFWAPEIFFHEGRYHMYVSYVRGVPQTWSGSRSIVYYSSEDLWTWSFRSILKLSSNRVIDPSLFRLPDASFLMWYKDESNGSYTYCSQSNDLLHWTSGTPCITDVAHEGPNVFFWRDRFWLIADMWKGQLVYHSPDARDWRRQSNILDEPGQRTDDNAVGQHADVLVQGTDAYIFYFTHPGRGSDPMQNADAGYDSRRSSLQVARLELSGDELVCERDDPFSFSLLPPD